MSIFAKDCPVCGISQPPETLRCSCGHRFDTSASSDDTQDLQSIYHEERLYRDYLAARVDEAAKLADAQALETARAELQAQEQRVLAVKKRLKLVRSNRRPKNNETQAPAKPAPPLPKPAVVVAPTVQSPRPAVKTRTTSPPISVKPRPPAPAPQPAPTTAPPRSNKAQPPHTVRADEKRVAPTPRGRTTTRPAPQPKARPRPAAAKPPDHPTAVAAPSVPDKPAPPLQAGEKNKAAMQECPNCSAKVPAGAARCACGFEISGHTGEMPSLPMSPEDRAAFLAALGPTRK